MASSPPPNTRWTCGYDERMLTMGPENTLALLRITFPDGTEQVVAATQSPFTIGRVSTCNLQLPHQLVSRNHARLLFQGKEIVLIDLNSSNGTMVGEKRLAPSDPYTLSYGEAFQIGSYTLRLESAPKATPARSAEPPEEKAAAERDQPPPAEGEEHEEAPVRISAAPPPPPPPAAPPPRADGESYNQAFGIPSDASRYLQYLPPIYHADPFLGRFLLAFEGVLAPIDQIVANFNLYLDPDTAPASFLDQLASWLGLSLDEKWPLEKRRAILTEAAELYRRRGTRWGLARHLEIYAGVTPEIREPEERPFHFEVRLRVPRGQSVDRATIERIIQANKPAHTTYSLRVVEGK